MLASVLLYTFTERYGVIIIEQLERTNDFLISLSDLSIVLGVYDYADQSMMFRFLHDFSFLARNTSSWISLGKHSFSI